MQTMWSNLFNLKNIIIAVLIGIILWQIFVIVPNKAKGDTVYIEGKPYEVVKHTVDTVYKWKDKIVYKDGSKIHYDTIYVPLPVKIDTLQVFKDYYAKYIATDTLMLDSAMGTITIRDTITQNRILNRQWSSHIKETTIRDILVVKELPKNQLYIGVDGSFNSVSFINSASVGLILKTKSDMLYKLGVGITDSHIGTAINGVTPYVGAGIYWKIRLKK